MRRNALRMRARCNSRQTLAQPALSVVEELKKEAVWLAANESPHMEKEPETDHTSVTCSSVDSFHWQYDCSILNGYWSCRVTADTTSAGRNLRSWCDVQELDGDPVKLPACLFRHGESCLTVRVPGAKNAALVDEFGLPVMDVPVGEKTQFDTTSFLKAGVVALKVQLNGRDYLMAPLQVVDDCLLQALPAKHVKLAQMVCTLQTEDEPCLHLSPPEPVVETTLDEAEELVDKATQEVATLMRNGTLFGTAGVFQPHAEHLITGLHCEHGAFLPVDAGTLGKALEALDTRYLPISTYVSYLSTQDVEARVGKLMAMRAELVDEIIKPSEFESYEHKLKNKTNQRVRFVALRAIDYALLQVTGSVPCSPSTHYNSRSFEHELRQIAASSEFNSSPLDKQVFEHSQQIVAAAQGMRVELDIPELGPLELRVLQQLRFNGLHKHLVDSKEHSPVKEYCLARTPAMCYSTQTDDVDAGWRAYVPAEVLARLPAPRAVALRAFASMLQTDKLNKVLPANIADWALETVGKRAAVMAGLPDEKAEAIAKDSGELVELLHVDIQNLASRALDLWCLDDSSEYLAFLSSKCGTKTGYDQEKLASKTFESLLRQ